VPSTTDVVVPAGVAVASAAATYLLGRRSQQGADEDRAYAQAWKLVEELREELDRLRAGVNARLAAAQADCDEQIRRLRADHDRQLADLRRDLHGEVVRAQARELIAQHRERYWHRAAGGRPIEGEPPPQAPSEEQG
jgi:hypothetical protein